VLATNIAGNINLDGIQAIQGALSAAPCKSSCSSFMALSSSTLVSVSGNISLDGILNLAFVEFPQLQTVGGAFALSDLASLQNLFIHSLASVGQFQLASAPKLSTLYIEQLQNVTGPSPSVEITSVNLTSAFGLSPYTNLSSYIFRDAPNLQQFLISTPHIDYFEFFGSKDLVTEGQIQLKLGVESGGTFNISGCGDVEFKHQQYTEPYSEPELIQHHYARLLGNP
jgi:hypothetical protein